MKVLTIALAASLALGVAYAEGTTPSNTSSNSNVASVHGKKTKKKRSKRKHKSTKSSMNSIKTRRARVRNAEAVAGQDRINTSAASETVLNAEPSNNVSTATTAPGLYQTLHDHVEASYFGIYRGSPINNPTGKYQPNVDGTVQGAGDADSAQSMESFVTLGYKPDAQTVIGVVPHFFYNGSPTADMSGNGQTLSAGFQMFDPLLMVSRANMFNGKNFKVKGYLYAELPVSNQDYLLSHNRGMLTAISPTLNMTYDFPGSRFSVGTYTYLRAYVPGANTYANTVAREYRLYVGPYANYQITSTFAATLWIDAIDFRHNSGSPFLSNFGSTNEEADIEPGVNWDVIPGKLSVNPQINIYPANPTLASTSIMAVVVGRAW